MLLAYRDIGSLCIMPVVWLRSWLLIPLGGHANVLPDSVVSLCLYRVCFVALGCYGRRSRGFALMANKSLALLSPDDLDALVDQGLLDAVGLAVDSGYCFECFALTALDPSGYCFACSVEHGAVMVTGGAR